MKRVILLFLFLTMICTTFAQKLTVESFEVKPMDLSASTSSRLDKNNVPCALVKVLMVDEISRVVGNVIGEVEDRGTEKWVYLSADTKMMKIVPARHVPLTITFADYGVKAVESKVTYELTLTEAQAAQQVKTQKLVINYTPKNATVLIDSKLYNGSGRVEAELPLGEHTYVIAANGYISAEATVKLNGGKERVFTEQLEKESAIITTQETVTQQVFAPVAATSGMENGHEWVDLGLSVCWATTNVGASTPIDYGDYFAWGETTAKDSYDKSTYKWRKNSNDSMTKYCTNSDYGKVDNKTELELTDDVAHVSWGGNWRMPTYDELEELKEKCDWTWIEEEKGYTVTGPNGKSIFLPAAGFRYLSVLNNAVLNGNYWSRTLCESDPSCAWDLGLFMSTISTSRSDRCDGQSVRPVRPSE